MPPSLPLTRRLLSTRFLASSSAVLPSSTTANTTLAFSTTAHQSYKQKPLDPPIPSPTIQDASIPPYPLGPRQVYKQANTGLYGSQRIRFGNKVSSKYEVKTRRKWRPNVQQKRLWSVSLNCMVRTRVTTRVLRTVDKCGGLDEYLLGGKSARVRELGPWGWRLRWRIMQTDAVKERFRAEREALGLPPVEEDGEWADVPGELAADGVSASELMAETDRMLESGEEFALGEDTLEGSPVQDDFMSEEKPSAGAETKV